MKPIPISKARGIAKALGARYARSPEDVADDVVKRLLRQVDLTPAPDDIRCEASIPHGKGEAAQCRRSKVAGRPYCAQHDKMARARVEAGMAVIAKLKTT